MIKKTVIECPTGAQNAVIADFSAPFEYVNQQGERKITCICTYQLAATYRNEMDVAVRKTVSEFITPSLHSKSKLRARIEGLLGKKMSEAEVPDTFDTASLVGKPCLLNIIADESGYPRIQSLSRLPEGTPAMKPEGFVRPAWVDEQVNKSKASDPSAAAPQAKVDLNDVLKRI